MAEEAPPQAPAPPPDGAAETSEAATSGDWRLSVPQSARNAEVREIAHVLAALEPGSVAASSKLRLAMQFEDSVFKQATGLSDYRKRLTKRLKKVQKSYVPPAAAATTGDAAKMATLQRLRAEHGEAIKYILRHADTAVQQMKLKHGAEKAHQLRQHTDGVAAWADDLGLMGSRTAPNPALLSDADVTKLQGLLERRMENIRSHVIKLADPDGFLGETLAKTETDLSDRARRVLAGTCRRRYDQLSRATASAASASASASASAATTTTTTTTTTAPTPPTTAATPSADDASQRMLQQALQALRRPVPLPTRNQRNDAEIGLNHLEKMAACSSILLGWALATDKSELPERGGLLTKAHVAAKEGVEAVTRVMADVRRASGEARQGAVTLEDAWKKVLAVPAPSIDEALEGGGAPAAGPRLSRTAAPVVRSRVLLTPGRKPPSNLLNALRRKRARLVRPLPRGEGSHLILDVGDAFTVTIYFVPLLVTLRAQRHPESRERPTESGFAVTDDSNVGCASMTPLCYGFDEYQRSDEGTATVNRDASPGSVKPLQVWGVRGPVEILGRVVEERLRDASAQATAVLRSCFAASAKPSANAFEIELLEATALLEFVQIARTTYEPDWQDDDA